MPRRLPSSLAKLLTLSATLLLSGCAGVGNYLHSTLDPFGDPNAPHGYALNMRRARGNQVAVRPILPQKGDIWPGKVRPIPTLSDIQQHMNTPLGQEYQDQYGPRKSTRHQPLGVTGSVQSPVPAEPNIPPTAATPAPSIGTRHNFNIGQTLMGPSGPAGVVTGSSNGRYQTVAPIDGSGGGILIPNGNGTATLIEPNGQVVSVQGH